MQDIAESVDRVKALLAAQIAQKPGGITDDAEALLLIAVDLVGEIWGNGRRIADALEVIASNTKVEEQTIELSATEPIDEQNVRGIVREMIERDKHTQSRNPHRG